MEKETEDNHMDFKRLYDTAPCGLLIFRMNGPIIYVNQTLLKWLGVGEEEIVAKKMTDLLDKAGVMYYELFVQPILKMHREAREISLSIQTSKGAFSCLFNGVAVDDIVGEGQLINAVIFKVDDRQKYEKELLSKRNKAEEESKVKTKALQEVSFDQSHLVRAPLANILGIIPMLEKTIDKNHKAHVLISMLQQSAFKLDNQIRAIVNKTNLKP
ncbi:PAS domain-containing protein [uncultured Pontibacter sp.]|uniref:PAS domain-containing protein n=1 Tax=uncultured Pontibacter sp. TaxID=453356 RepID=UPI00261695BD|nr:PAS domain-containing protein [uncultured Pontibacter sp.]